MSTNGSNGTFPLRPGRVLKTVAKAYGLTVAELTAPGRSSRAVTQARLVAYVLLREECWLSWPRIAETTGRVPHGGSIIAQARNADPEAVAELRARLRPDGHQQQLFR